MTHCIVTPANQTVPLAHTDLDNIQDYWTVVGGYVEATTFGGPALALLVDEDDKLKGPPFNRRATSLWWLHEPRARNIDFVVGAVVLIGAADNNGEASDVPAGIVTLLLEGRSFTIEARFTDAPDDWTGVSGVFTDYFEAASTAVKSLTRLYRPDDTRVQAIS